MARFAVGAATVAFHDPGGPYPQLGRKQPRMAVQHHSQCQQPASLPPSRVPAAATRSPALSRLSP